MKKFAEDNNVEYAKHFTDPEINLTKNELIGIGYSLFELVKELPSSRLGALRFKPERIADFVKEKAIRDSAEYRT